MKDAERPTFRDPAIGATIVAPSLESRDVDPEDLDPGRSIILIVILAVVLGACDTRAPNASAPGPNDDHAVQPVLGREDGREGVTLDVLPSGSNRCCEIYTVNPGPRLSVGCFVYAFDGEGDLRSTTLIPPRPPGRPRSSGFIAPHGRHGQGFFTIDMHPAGDSYVALCRPAAWHGGAPI